MNHPITPDGRYFVVRGRLWRMADPALPPERRAALTRELMAARRAVGAALRAEDAVALGAARAAVDAAKRALGERGPAWWTDGAPDVNRHLVRNTLYAGWHAALRGDADQSGRRGKLSRQCRDPPNPRASCRTTTVREFVPHSLTG